MIEAIEVIPGGMLVHKGGAMVYVPCEEREALVHQERVGQRHAILSKMRLEGLQKLADAATERSKWRHERWAEQDIVVAAIEAKIAERPGWEWWWPWSEARRLAGDLKIEKMKYW